MIKKYGSKIFTSVSFTEIAISNIKAAEKTGDVTIMIGEKAYKNSGSTLTNNKTAPVDVLCEIGTFKSSLKDADSQAIDLTGAEKKYFIKEIKCLFNPINDDVKFNEADGQCNINTDGQISIELVKKEDVMEIVYDTNCKKKLKDSCIKTIFEKIVQGVALQDLGLNAIISDESTLGEKAINGAEILGKDIQLPTDNNKIQLIVNDIESGNFKTFILELSDEVKNSLVKGLDLSKFADLDVGTIITDENKGTTAFTKLNSIKVGATDDDKNFFKGKFEILKEGDENIKVETDKDAEVKNFSGGTFYILKDIKKENINAKYLKKTFDVKLDSADTNKAVDSEDINTLINALNKEFGDSVKFSTNDIWTELKKQNTIIRDTFNSSIKITKGTTDNSKPVGDNNDLIDENTTEFIIKLPEEAFATGVVQGAITLTFDTKDIKKGSRKLKNEIISAIEDAMKKINTKTTKDNFVTKINSIDSLKRVNNENFVADDFNFGSTVESGSNEINNDGNISFTDSGIKKLDDSCFEPEDKQKTNDSKGNSGSGDSTDSDEQKESNCVCCCKKNNN